MVLHWSFLVAVALTGADPSAAARSLPPVRFSRAAAVEALEVMSPRVRSTSTQVAGLLREGIRRSITFADLIARLSVTDLIVYVEPSRDLPRTLDGRVLLLPMTRNQRYVRAEIRTDLPLAEQIGVIAHELQHALEIAVDERQKRGRRGGTLPAHRHSGTRRLHLRHDGRQGYGKTRGGDCG